MVRSKISVERRERDYGHVNVGSLVLCAMFCDVRVHEGPC